MSDTEPATPQTSTLVAATSLLARHFAQDGAPVNAWLPDGTAVQIRWNDFQQFVYCPVDAHPQQWRLVDDTMKYRITVDIADLQPVPAEPSSPAQPQPHDSPVGEFEKMIRAGQGQAFLNWLGRPQREQSRRGEPHGPFLPRDRRGGRR